MDFPIERSPHALAASASAPAKAPPLLNAHGERPGPRRRLPAAPGRRLPAGRWTRARAPLAIVCGALGLWLAAGVGFVNYDTLYGLVWGQQLTRGETPQYAIQLAPTPHPLVEALGAVLAPLGATLTTAIVVGLAFLALSACGWALYRLGREWFGPAAGIVAAAVALTRTPVLSYGVRAYVDVPYMLLVLLALLVETRRRRAGAPVLALLALAGLLRPEAWAFSGAYWLYLAAPSLRAAGEDRSGRAGRPAGEDRSQQAAGEDRSGRAAGEDRGERTGIPAGWRQLAALALLALAAPLLWLLSDLLVTGDALWSLSNTKHMAHELGRVTGIANVPEYIPRRIGEIMRPAGLAGAAVGGTLSLLWLPARARTGAAAGVLAVMAFACTAAFGLPIDTRYAFLAAAILAVFCGAGAFGWMALPRGGTRRRVWMALGALVTVALVATLPLQLRSASRELSKLARQQHIQDDLVALAGDGSLSLRCGPVGVPSHAPIPLLALYLNAAPSRIADTQHSELRSGDYADPASVQVEHEYVLNADGRPPPVSIPPGFTEAGANSSWLLFQRCA